MTFSKSFPKGKDKYPIWEEVYLTEEEERISEEAAKKENIELMRECIKEAKKIIQEEGLKDYQSDVISMALSLFDKTASHQIYHKEAKAKEKFDKENRSE